MLEKTEEKSRPKTDSDILTKSVFGMIVLGYKSARPVAEFLNIQCNKHHLTVQSVSWLSQPLKVQDSFKWSTNCSVVK